MNKTLVQERYERLAKVLPYEGDSQRYADLTIQELTYLKSRLYTAFIHISAKLDEKVLCELNKQYTKDETD